MYLLTSLQNKHKTVTVSELGLVLKVDKITIGCRECVRNLDLRVHVHPGELWVSKQLVHIVLEASKGDVPKICGFVHPLHPC